MTHEYAILVPYSLIFPLISDPGKINQLWIWS